MKDIVQELISKVAFWVCLGVSLVLLILGFAIPPLGVINPSVLTAVGEIFAFAALAAAIDAIKEGYDAKIKKGEVEINLNNDKNK